MEARDSSGATALHHAASNGHNSMVWLLVDTLGANKEASDSSGCTSLHHAAWNGRDSSIVLLVDYLGAETNSMDSSGGTALNHAAAKGYDSTVRLLVDYLGANKEAMDNNGCTALHYAAWNGHESTVRVLAKDANIEITEAVVATCMRHDLHGRQVIELLLRNGAHASLHYLSIAAATFLIQHWLNELAVGNLAWLKSLAEEGFSPSELAELVSQQTQLDGGNYSTIQLLHSKADFPHQEFCAHSFASKSQDENLIRDDDNQFFLHPDSFYNQQYQLQRKLVMYCGIGGLVDQKSFCLWNNTPSDQAAIVYDSNTILNPYGTAVCQEPAKKQRYADFVVLC
jgi:ankyrin repeat protein